MNPKFNNSIISKEFDDEDGFQEAYDYMLDNVDNDESLITLEKQDNLTNEWKSTYLGKPFGSTYDEQYNAFLKHENSIFKNTFRLISNQY